MRVDGGTFKNLCSGKIMDEIIAMEKKTMDKIIAIEERSG